MTTRGYNNYNSLIIRTLNKISVFNKCRKDFFCEVVILLLSIKGRVNFLQLGRFGNFKEQRYRQQFEKPFPWLDFNKELTLSHGGSRFVIAFDPSYINKSGKKTPGVGWYWSGCAGQSKWGLEIGGLAAIDLDNHTAFHLEAVQTLIEDKQATSLTDWYVNVIKERKETLSSISKYLVADAWFSKKPFVDQIIGMDMHLISRLRDDADLKYLYLGPPTGKRGRPSKYAGKVITENIDTNYFELIEQNQEATVYSAIVYSKALKRNIRLVHVTYTSDKGKQIRKLYFSTDTQMDALEILDCYQSRFQIEFLYRDAKQYTGLNDSQARSENKLNFQFNAALTAINIAKVEHWLSQPKEARKPFSMTDIKTMNHNRLLLQRFIDVFGVNAYSAKNRNHVNELIYYGTIAA
ncbi:Transposase DDE domain-containing protein [Bacteroides faecichinchillae]|uniref:Transposase DDE domain-containing protein n=3 Tax=Bacteroidia TaxID=200643 RepID=A0A1M5GPT2_9BACE|nr:transposase [Bacteroides faecichinchillae]SHG05667.1 Transposase DDE domain-containing protein [Bacteroides faecichinchillae]